MLRKALSLTLLIGFSMAGLGKSASAQLDFHVSLNTATLAGGSFFVDFSLSDGSVGSSGVPDTNNTITINNFSLDGGTAGAIAPPTLGNASGNIASGFTLSDGDPLGTADIAQEFTPGSILSFDVHSTTNVDAGGTPDLFLFRLLDSSQNTIATNDPNPPDYDGFIELNLSSTTLTVSNVGAFGSSNPVLAAPIVTDLNPATPPVPEPGALALLIGGLCSGSAFAFRRRQRR